MVRPCSRRLQQLLESAIIYFFCLSDYLEAFHPFNLGAVTTFPGYTRATLLSLPGGHCWRTWHDNDRLNSVSGTWVFFCLRVCVELRHQTFSSEGLRSLMLQNTICAQYAVHGQRECRALSFHQQLLPVCHHIIWPMGTDWDFSSASVQVGILFLRVQRQNQWTKPWPSGVTLFSHHPLQEKLTDMLPTSPGLWEVELQAYGEEAQPQAELASFLGTRIQPLVQQLHRPNVYHLPCVWRKDKSSANGLIWGPKYLLQ